MMRHSSGFPGITGAAPPADAANRNDGRANGSRRYDNRGQQTGDAASASQGKRHRRADDAGQPANASAPRQRLPRPV